MANKIQVVNNQNGTWDVFVIGGSNATIVAISEYFMGDIIRCGYRVDDGFGKTIANKDKFQSAKKVAYEYVKK